MAEHGLTGPVIGVTLDGTGFGTDGAIWGGEFLVGDYRQIRRAAHLRYVGMPGGERAVREPWRMAAAHLADAGIQCASLQRRIGEAPLQTIGKMLERKFNCPLTSSAGRLFDAVAAIAGVRDRASYEGQAAIELEWLATGQPMAGSYPIELAEAKYTPPEDKDPYRLNILHAGASSAPPRIRPALDESGAAQRLPRREGISQEGDPLGIAQEQSKSTNGPSPQPSPPGTGEREPEPVGVNQAVTPPAMVIDTRPMIRAIAIEVDAGVDRAVIARKFHSTWVEIISVICRKIREATGENSVVLSGGVFMNALLAVEVVERLNREGFCTFRHRLVPCNDGGLSLGQLAVAASQIRELT